MENIMWRAYKRRIIVGIFFFIFFITLVRDINGEIQDLKKNNLSKLMRFSRSISQNNNYKYRNYNKRTSFDIRYNRVEGLYTGIRVKEEVERKRYPKEYFFYGLYGYSLTMKKFQYKIGVEKGFFDKLRLAIGGEYHSMVDTPDRWIIGDLENSLAAFLFKEDFQDFYHRLGGSGYIVQNLSKNLSITAAYQIEQFKPLDKNTNWSILGGKKNFRNNPMMDEGEIRNFTGKVVYDSRNSIKKTSEGWYIQIEAEHAGSDLEGDFNFDRILLDVRRYQPLKYGTSINFRIRIGTSHGTLPWQRSFHLGGISTLRGYSFKEFPCTDMQPGGNRMILAQIEYQISNAGFANRRNTDMFDFFNIFVFFDTGWINKVGYQYRFTEGYKSLTWSKLKSNIGLAFSDQTEDIRFEIIRRTDTGKKPYTFLVRLNRPF
jgi:hypothetical protein